MLKFFSSSFTCTFNIFPGCEDDDKTFVIFVSIFAEKEYKQKACKLAGELYSKSRKVLIIEHRTDILVALRGQLIYAKAGHCLYHDEYQYNIYLPSDIVSDWSSWSLNVLQKFEKTFHNSGAAVLIWITQSQLNEREHGISNLITRYFGSFNSTVTIYNIRPDPTIRKNNIRVIPSAVKEILVRNLEMVNAIGPWLFRDECTGKTLYINYSKLPTL